MKKSLLLLIAFCLCFSFAFSQTFVSTDPLPRNVVLEEFTGIHCMYCPGGHRNANKIATAYPGKVFLVNIHTTEKYAKPKTDDQPDLRTPAGEIIAATAGLKALPSASINRSSSVPIIYQEKWDSVAQAFMAQTSPVNVAVKASVDMKTRTLTTEVEVYYTDNSSSDKNYLTVVLTQDDIRGYQYDPNDLNPTNWDEDGNYKHNHVLRMVISESGPFGDLIETTKKGNFVSKKYVSVLPDDIAGVEMYMYKLNVVAFVAESEANILSAGGAEVSYGDVQNTDLAIADKTVYDGFAFTSIHPKAEVTNNTTGNQITGFTASCIVKGVEYSKEFTGTLDPGQKTTIEWDEIPFTATGAFSIKFRGFKNINNNTLFDLNFLNDKSVSKSVCLAKDAIVGNFDAGFNDGKVPENLGLDDSKNSNFTLVQTMSSGAKDSKFTIVYLLGKDYGVEGKAADILFGEADLTKFTDPWLTFYYAYFDGGKGGTPPTVKAQASFDKGITWTDLRVLSAVETSTAYLPKSADYKPVTVSLDSYKGQTEAIFRISVIPGSDGMTFFIDEVSLTSGPTAVEEEAVPPASLTLRPNPAVDEIVLSGEQYNGKEYLVYNMLGELVLRGVNSGSRIDVGGLSSGAYVIRINNEVLKFVKE